MSDFVSLMARSWSGVSSKMNEPSNSALPRDVRREGGGRPCDSRTGLNLQQFGGRRRARHARPVPLPCSSASRPSVLSARTHFANADVFADEMRLGDGHVKFWRFVAGMAGRVFDDEALGAG